VKDKGTVHLCSAKLQLLHMPPQPCCRHRQSRRTA